MNRVSTIGIFAHANAGKTTLTEQLLFHTGVLRKPGRVDHGNTTTDRLDVEKSRGISVRATYVSFNLDDVRVQLVDTPGHVDFSAEVIRAINILDCAVLVISGVEGIEAQTSVIWNLLLKRNIPVIIFINKMDRKGADFNMCLKEIRHLLSPSIVLENSALEIDGSLIIKTSTNAERLEDISSQSTKAANYYLNCLENNKKEDVNIIDRYSKELFYKGKIYPVCMGSVLNNMGVTEFIEILKKYIPSKERKEGEDKDFAGYVYTVIYNDGNKESYVKVLQGKLEKGMSLEAEAQSQKIKNLFLIQGNSKVAVDEVYKGELAIVNGITFLSHGMMLGKCDFKHNTIEMNLKPMFTSKVIPFGYTSHTGLIESLRKLNEEDPLLNMRYDVKSRQIQLDLMGELQGETIIALLKEKHGVEAQIEKSSIIYKETASQTAQAKAGYSKNSWVELRIIPKKRGEGFSYNSLINTDILFLSYQKQVARLVSQYINMGIGEYGWEITDAEVQLINAKCEHAGSEPFHYNVCVPIALARAIRLSRPILLEPLVKYSIRLPGELKSEILSSIISLSNDYECVSMGEGYEEITGTALLSKISNYVLKIKKISRGKAVLEYMPFGYTKKEDTEIVKNPYTECDFSSEEIFLSTVRASIINLY